MNDDEIEVLWHEPRARKGKQTRKAERTPKPRIKTSYESNADVQRWLQDQSLGADRTREAWNPSFLAGKRDQLWILSSLEHFYERGLIIDIVNEVKSGKEATVYCCRAAPEVGVDYLAAKVYRPRMFRSLSNDALYRGGREQRDADGRLIRGGGARGIDGGGRGRAGRVRTWIEYEFETQRLLHAAGVDVPRPWVQQGNAILMEYIGIGEQAAPALRAIDLSRAEAEKLWQQITSNIERCLANHRIHGDLSAYNILYRGGEATIIDFAQAVDPRQDDDLYPLLERDIARVYHYVQQYGIVDDPQRLADELWRRYQSGDPLLL